MVIQQYKAHCDHRRLPDIVISLHLEQILTSRQFYVLSLRH